MSKSEKRLFLLDAYALIYRAHFAFTKTPRINSKGVNTSVAFGFTNTLLEVLQKQKPTHIAVAFATRYSKNTKLRARKHLRTSVTESRLSRI
jgi:DNA polymerase-1